MQFHRALNSVRHNYYVSHIARRLAYPIRNFCNFLSQEIQRKIRINGGGVQYDGIKLCFPKNIAMGLAGGIYWDDMHGFEPYNWQILRVLLRKDDVKHFVDIGSNYGIYAILAKKYNSSLVVDAFEPVPSIFEKNLLLHRANGLKVDAQGKSEDGTIRIWQKAVSNKNGITILHLPINVNELEEESTGTLRPDSWQADRQQDKVEISVETITLDDYFQKIDLQGRIVIKIDVEDFEAAVFAGAKDLLKKVKPYIICEILKREHGNQETYQILKSLNYKVFGITAKGLFVFNSEDFFASRPCADFFCIHEDTLAENHLLGRNYLSFEDMNNI